MNTIVLITHALQKQVPTQRYNRHLYYIIETKYDQIF